MKQRLNSEFIHPDIYAKYRQGSSAKLQTWMNKRHGKIPELYVDTSGSVINSGRRAETQLKKHLKMNGKQLRKYLKKKKRELHSDEKGSRTESGMDQQVTVRND